MTAADLAPPAHPRCQIYYQADPLDEKALERCPRRGTHWVKWSGCSCQGGDRDEDCMDDFYSWECDEHDPPVKEAA